MNKIENKQTTLKDLTKIMEKNNQHIKRIKYEGEHIIVELEDNE
jgi:hypothetical protein|tara:strand:- start:758 stop:889 length:132 start_codon:yes stop_codon:yes gene_type:complete